MYSDEEHYNPDDFFEETWIEWFCDLRENEFLCEVDERFIRDEFNMYGFEDIIPHYSEAKKMLIDESDDSLPEEARYEIERSAKSLYGLIHARYILTAGGMKKMLEKYTRGEFGTCPRALCDVCSFFESFV